MDYGSHLKATIGNLSKKSKTYKKQLNFKESNRYIRGAIIRTLATGPLIETQLLKTLAEIDKNRLKMQLDSLVSESLILKTKNIYQLP
jgi:DNA-binding HxlR family transcriptional regulator